MAELNHVENSLSNTDVPVQKRIRTCKYITEEQKKQQREKQLEYDRQYYRNVTLAKKEKKENKEKIELTEEEKAKKEEEHRLKRQEYNKKYFQNNKEKVNKQNRECWKKRRAYLIDLARTPEIVELYNKLKSEKGVVEDKEKLENSNGVE